MISGCAALIILFLYCFPVAINYFDNYGVKGNADHFVIPALGQRQLSTLPQLNDESLRVQPVIEEELLRQQVWSS